MRPLNAGEKGKGQTKIWKVMLEHSCLAMLCPDGKTSARDAFTFDNVLNTDSTTVQLFEKVAKPIPRLERSGGTNGTVFAYGQTSCGKTYTM